MKRKNYDQELAALHAELVSLQEWVVREGAKICIVFEGRDGAGKGDLLGKIPYKSVPRKKVKLPPRQKRGGYREPDYPFKLIEERF